MSAPRARGQKEEADKLFEDYTKKHGKSLEKLTLAEVAALRLYTGPPYKAINDALRTQKSHPEKLRAWATTIACCTSGLLKLSMLVDKKQRVYRGVKEDSGWQLPNAFFKGVGDFAGGVELGFSSTTTSPEVALFYSGKGRGTILSFEYSATTRGASLEFLSQFPHEVEYLVSAVFQTSCPCLLFLPPRTSRATRPRGRSSHG